jgi:Aspartyl protease
MKLTGRMGPLLKGGCPDRSLRVRFLKLSLCNDPNFKNTAAGPPKILAAGLVGLIDTGADFCQIDRSLAERYSLTKVNQIRTATAGGVSQADTFYGQLYFLEIDFRFDAPTMPSNNFVSSGLFFDTILGMGFLSCFDLRIRAKNDMVELELLGR